MENLTKTIAEGIVSNNTNCGNANCTCENCTCGVGIDTTCGCSCCQ